MLGKRLLHYEITEKLGEGGMGVVYRARDTHLGRFVAIKVLPLARTADPTRKARFVQEAKAASALSHPNIVVIHDIAFDVGISFIVMEYVAGRTLDELIPRKGMRLGEALKIAIQIADGIARAHAAGIVHRDLKPSNVMVDEHGGVKIVDFGLAKLTETAATSEDSPTRTLSPKTEEGQIVGTVAYLSPEQAEGRKLDGRSDIFSFGALLYEMTTGQRAFRGETAISTISAILHEEPKRPSQLASDIPRDLEKIIVRCLRKDPERRFQHMGDVRVALLELKEESDSGQEPAPSVARTPPARRMWLWALVAITALSLGTGLWLGSRQASPMPQQTLVPVTSYAGFETYPSFSPDGRQIAFSWDGENGDNPGIYVKLVGETNALRLTSGSDTYPAWAPDGKRIAFVRVQPERGVYTVSPLGGAERKLAGLAASSQLSWSPDGKWLALSLGEENERGILLLTVEGGDQRQISNPKPPAFDRNPAFAPDGLRLAYESCTGVSSCDVYVQALTEYFPRGHPTPITRQGARVFGVTWSRDGSSLIYAASRIAGLLPYLWRVRADGTQAPERMEIAGPLAHAPSASVVSDRLVFYRSLQDYDIWCYRPDGGMKPLIVSSLNDCNPQFSPDGTRIVFESSRSGDAEEVWVAEADGSRPVQLTSLIGRHQGSPRWSPDGRWIAFDSQGHDGHWRVYVVEATGGPPRRITSSASDTTIPSWSRDGKWIYFRSDLTGRFEIWRVPSAGGEPERCTTRRGSTAHESADGKTLFYTKADVGPLFAKQLSGGDEQEVLPYVYSRAFVPVADGIYYIGRRTKEGHYPLEFFSFSDRSSRLLAKIEGGVSYGLTVSPDRKSILFGRSVSVGADLMMIDNFR